MSLNQLKDVVLLLVDVNIPRGRSLIIDESKDLYNNISSSLMIIHHKTKIVIVKQLMIVIIQLKLLWKILIIQLKQTWNETKMEPKKNEKNYVIISFATSALTIVSFTELLKNFGTINRTKKWKIKYRSCWLRWSGHGESGCNGRREESQRVWWEWGEGKWRTRKFMGIYTRK